MPLTDDVRRLIEILEKEGFGRIAGELMVEINLGRPDERGPDDQVDALGEIPETGIVYVPLEDEEQLEFAIEWLRLRILEPVRCFVEAELIATELNEGVKTRINFIDIEFLGDVVSFNTGNIGDFSALDSLEKIFAEILDNNISPMNRGI